MSHFQSWLSLTWCLEVCKHEILRGISILCFWVKMKHKACSSGVLMNHIRGSEVWQNVRKTLEVLKSTISDRAVLVHWVEGHKHGAFLPVNITEKLPGVNYAQNQAIAICLGEDWFFPRKRSHDGMQCGQSGVWDLGVS